MAAEEEETPRLAFQPQAKAGLSGVALDRARRAGEARIRKAFLETAFWTPNLVTDKKGRGQVTFDVPAQATRWRVIGRGVTPETVVGEGTVKFKAKRDFFLEIKVPRVLTEGDRPRFVVKVHNLTEKTGRARLKLRLRWGERVETFPAELEIKPKGVTENTFPPAPPVPSVKEVKIEAEITASFPHVTFNDLLERSVSVRPWGLEFSDSRSGILSDTSSFELELPPGRTYSKARLTVELGPGIARLLIDEALRRGPLARGGPNCPTNAGAAAELLGVCGAASYLGKLQRAEAPEYRLLLERAQTLSAQLIASQRSDGGWSWAGSAGASDPRTSALCLWALGKAVKLAIPVPAATVSKAINFTRTAFTKAPQEANELKAMLLHALSVHGRGDFAFANRLYRLRGSLSPAALAYTTLTLVEMKNAPMAAETAALLEKHVETIGEAGPGRKGLRWKTAANEAWNRAPGEMTALAVLALERARPRSKAVERGAEYLISHRPWYPAKVHGMTLLALSVYYAEAKPTQAAGEVTVTVNGRSAPKVKLSSEGKSQLLSFGIPTGNRAKIELRLAGRGQASYLAVLSGFSSDVKPVNCSRFKITEQVYTAHPPVYKGRSIRTGFSILSGTYTRWKNAVKNLPLGGMTHVSIDIDRLYDSRTPQGDDDYLAAEVAIPGGHAPPPERNSSKGAFPVLSTTGPRETES